MSPVRTAILSDLHLGKRERADLLRHAAPRAALAEALRPADQVILLGDVLELRDAPVADILEIALPVLTELGEAIGDARVVVVPGNHDHQLASEWLERRRVARRPAPLALEQVVKPSRSGLLGRVAGAFSGEVALAYPGVFVRPDVYATHGHHLDCHVTVPSLEALAVATTARLAGGPPRPGSLPDDYEQALVPLYSLLYELAQSERRARRPGRTDLSARLWRRVQRQGPHPSSMLLRRAVPLAAAAANRAGLGPFRADLSIDELGRSGLRAMGEVIERLEIPAAHVVFGHTHRAGPLSGDVSGWARPGGPRLHNCGSWVHEPAFIGARGSASGHWPGRLVVVEDDAPPRLEQVLERLP